MKKYRLLTALFSLGLLQISYFAQAADTSAAVGGSVGKKSATEIKNQKLTELDRFITTLQTEFGGLPQGEHRPTLLNQLAIRVTRAQKMLKAFVKEAKNPEVIALQERLTKLTNQITPPEQSKLFGIPPLPEDLAHNYYPRSTVALPHTGAQTDFQQTAPLPRGFSPDRGWFIATNGLIKQLMTDEKTSLLEAQSLAKALFNISQEGNVVLTALPGNPAISLSPAIAAQIIRLVHADILTDPTTFTPELFRQLEPFLEEWYTAYHTQEATKPGKIRSLGDFKSRAKEFLTLVAASAHKDKNFTTDLLLASVALRIKRTPFLSDKVALFKEYGTALTETEPEIIWYHQQDFDFVLDWYNNNSYTQETVAPELEHISYLIKNFGSEDKLKNLIFFNSEDAFATYSQVTFPSCAENTIRTLLNMIFYNPETQTLSLNMLPPALQESVSPDLKAFINQHGTLRHSGDLTIEEQQAADAASQAFIHLVENRPGINYKDQNNLGKRYNLEAPLENVIKILKQLLGLHFETTQTSLEGELIEIFKQVSTPEHNIQVECTKKSWSWYGSSFTLVLFLSQRAESLTVSLELDNTHAKISTEKNILRSNTSFKNCYFLTLYYASLLEKIFLLGSLDIHLVKIMNALAAAGLLATQDALTHFFNFYTTGSCPKKFPELFYFYNFSVYLMPVYGRLPEDVQFLTQIRQFMRARGYTTKDAFFYALEKKDIPQLQALIDRSAESALSDKTSYYSPQGPELVTFLNFIGGLPALQQLNLIKAAQWTCDFSQPLPFEDGTKTPLMWAYEQKKILIFYTLIEANVRPCSQDEVVNVLSFLASKDKATQAEYVYTQFLSSVKRAGFSLVAIYPFQEGPMSILEWALYIKNPLVLEALLKNNLQPTAENSLAILDHLILTHGKELSRTHPFIQQLKNHTFDFSDNSQTPLLLEKALTNECLEGSLALLRHGGVLSSPEQFVLFLEQLAPLAEWRYSQLTAQEIFTSADRAGLTFTQAYPFSQGLMTPGQWAQLPKNKALKDRLEKCIILEQQPLKMKEQRQAEEEFSRMIDADFQEAARKGNV